MRKRDYWYVIDCTKLAGSAVFKTRFQIIARLVSKFGFDLDYFQPMTWKLF